MTKYAMVIDKKRCVGCARCAMACTVEHNLPNGVRWNHAETEGGEGFKVPGVDANGKVWMGFYTFACQHCDNPACEAACPTGATFKRDDGIVDVNWEECIGCKSCIKACPYEGVRTFIDGEPEYHLDFAVGDQEMPEHLPNTVEKCTFCVQRIDRGEMPRCIDLCFAHARHFGDLDDPDSVVSKLLAEREYEQLLPEEGTGPNVYYLV